MRPLNYVFTILAFFSLISCDDVKDNTILELNNSTVLSIVLNL